MISIGNNVTLLVLSRIIAGVFKQTQELSRLAIVNTKSEDERAQAIGIFNSIGSAGFIIGPTVGGNIREYFGLVGFSICAKITSFMFIINALIVYFTMPDVTLSQKLNDKKTEARSTYRILREMWDLCLVRLFLTMGILMTRFVMPILCDRAFGPAKSGYLTSFTALSGTISAALASVWIPKVLTKINSVKAEALVCLGLGGTLLLMGLSWATQPIWSIYLSMLFLNCFFTQCSRILLTELTAQRSPKEQRGTVMGTVTSLTALSRAGTDSAIAALLLHSDTAPIYCGCFLMFCSSSLLFKISSAKIKVE